MRLQRQERVAEERCQGASYIGQPEEKESEPRGDLEPKADPPVMDEVGDRHHPDRQGERGAKCRRHPNPDRFTGLHCRELSHYAQRALISIAPPQ